MKLPAVALVALALLGFAFGAHASDLERSVSVKPGGTLEIDLSQGAVEIETHERSDVEVTARASGLAAGSYRFELEGDGTNARLVGRSEGMWLWFGPTQVRVRVRVPRRYSVDVQTGGGSIEIDGLRGAVRARTSGGSIEVDGAEGNVELRTSGGRLRAERIEGDLAAETSGGSIEVADVTGRVEIRTSGGGIRAHDVAGPVQARTSGGSISVRFTARPGGELQTSGGSIEADLPPGAGVNLDASTSGGRVKVDAELNVSGSFDAGHVVGRIHGGGPDLVLRTSGGNVTVRAR